MSFIQRMRINLSIFLAPRSFRLADLPKTFLVRLVQQGLPVAELQDLPVRWVLAVPRDQLDQQVRWAQLDIPDLPVPLALLEPWDPLVHLERRVLTAQRVPALLALLDVQDPRVRLARRAQQVL